MSTQKILLRVCFLLTLALSTACVQVSDTEEKIIESDPQAETAFVTTMQKHLDAVSNKDLETLASTLSPDGNMQLILPGEEIIHSAQGFLDFHQEWFQDTSWTFETKILDTEIGHEMGIAITEIVYREPDRAGVPYFNRMIVSYALQKTAGEWYIIKDHASSIEKSTD